MQQFAAKGLTGVILILVIGAVFGAYYDRTRRLWPVVFAHSFIDVIAQVRLSAGAEQWRLFSPHQSDRHVVFANGEVSDEVVDS